MSNLNSLQARCNGFLTAFQVQLDNYQSGLGSYWQGTYSFQVEGMDVPVAYLSVSGDPR